MAAAAPPRHTPPTRQFLGVGIVVLGESRLTRTRAIHNDNTEKNRGGYLNTMAKARRVHFVGSIPLANVAEVFRVVAGQFGDLASRIPDGETGARSHWIQFQRTAMDEAANLAKVREYAPPTVIFLGLIHISDGLEGSIRRLKAASEYLAAFGVATECGFGRRDPHTIGDLLNLHVQVARAAPSELSVEDPPIAQGAPSRTVHERFR